jgi:hypothetical protein
MKARTVIPDDPEIQARVPGVILIARDIKRLISWITCLAHHAVLRHS